MSPPQAPLLQGQILAVDGTFSEIIPVFIQRTYASWYHRASFQQSPIIRPIDWWEEAGWLCLFVLLFGVVHVFGRELVFRPFAKKALKLEEKKQETEVKETNETSSKPGLRQRQTKTSNENEKNEKPIAKPTKKLPSEEKFVVSCNKFVMFTFLVLFGFISLSNENWTFQPSLYFQSWPHTPLSLACRFYYRVEFAHYIYGVVALFYEPRMKDFSQMLLHHIVTLHLIFFSYVLGYHRIGCVVLLLHDTSDPWMEIAKLFFYTGQEAFANLFFVLFAACFIFTRDYLFPLGVIWSAISSFLSIYATDLPYGIECVVFLMILQGLHLFWSSLILKMIMEAITSNGVQGDTRED